MQTRLRRMIVCTKGLKPATRLVGAELADSLNYFRGDAFPSQNTIAETLDLTERTVRESIPALKAFFDVRRQGKHFRYTPKWALLNITPEKSSGVTPEKFDTDTGKKQPSIPEKKGSESCLLSNSISGRGAKSVIAAADRLVDRVRSFDDPAPIEHLPLGEAAWLSVKDVLMHHFGEDVRKSWFDKLAFVGIVDGTVTLIAETRFQQNAITTRYHSEIEQAWQHEVQGIKRVRLLLPHEISEAAE